MTELEGLDSALKRWPNLVVAEKSPHRKLHAWFDPDRSSRLGRGPTRNMLRSRGRPSGGDSAENFACGYRCCRIVERVCPCIGLVYQSPGVQDSNRSSA